MINNNISNRQAPSLLFRLDNFVVKPQKEGLKDKVLNYVKGESSRSKIDGSVSKIMYDVFRYTDFTMGLVVLEKEWHKYPQRLKEQITDLPIKDIYLVIDHFDIYSKLQNGEYLFYVDDSEENHKLVGHHACITMKELNTSIKGGYKYV